LERTRRLLALALLLATMGSIGAQEKPRLAIQSFGNPKEFPNSGIAETLTGQLRTGLAATGRFQILQGVGTGLDAVDAEQGLAKSGKSQAASSPRVGRFAGAQYLLTGSVTEFSYKEQKFTDTSVRTAGSTGVEVFLQTATVRLDFQLVDAETRAQVFAATGIGGATARSATSQMTIYNRLVATQGSVTTELKDSLMGRAADQAVRDLVRKLSDGSNVARQALADATGAAERERLSAAAGEIVAELADGNFVVSVGRDAGIVVGTILNVETEVISRDKTGKEVYRERVPVGVLRVTDVSMRDRAKAAKVSVAAATRQPRAGDHVAPEVTAGNRPAEAGPVSAPAGRAPSTVIAPERRAGGPGEAQVRQADRYLEDGLFAEAADQYRRAMAAEGESAPLLEKLSQSLFATRDFLEGEKTAERIVAAGNSYSTMMIHRHGFGRCLGHLRIGPQKLAFQATTGDHVLSLDPSQIIRFDEVSATGFGAGRDVPALEVTYRDVKGDEEKFTLMAMAYAKLDSRRVYVEGKDLEDTTKLHRVLKRLVSSYVLPTTSH